MTYLAAVRHTAETDSDSRSGDESFRYPSDKEFITRACWLEEGHGGTRHGPEMDWQIGHLVTEGLGWIDGGIGIELPALGGDAA